jgi:hypothetical protein
MNWSARTVVGTLQRAHEASAIPAIVVIVVLQPRVLPAAGYGALASYGQQSAEPSKARDGARDYSLVVVVLRWYPTAAELQSSLFCY